MFRIYRIYVAWLVWVKDQASPGFQAESWRDWSVLHRHNCLLLKPHSTCGMVPVTCVFGQAPNPWKLHLQLLAHYQTPAAPDPNPWVESNLEIYQDLTVSHIQMLHSSHYITPSQVISLGSHSCEQLGIVIFRHLWTSALQPDCNPGSGKWCISIKWTSS